MNRLRVLVAEDDAVIAMLFAEVLTGMGYDVCAIESTEADLVVAAARCRPDVMIVDVRLRNGSGVSAVEKFFDPATFRMCSSAAIFQAFGRLGHAQW